MWNPSVLGLLALFASRADLPSTPDVLRSGDFRFAAAALSRETLSLELFEGETLEAVRERIVPLGPDGFTWIGRARSDPASSIVLSVHRGALSGSVRTSSSQYRIRPAGAGLYRVDEVAPGSEPPERHPLSTGRPSRTRRSASLDDGRTIDLLVLYTPRAGASAGGAGSLTSLVALGIAETNLALEKSEVDTRLRLVELREVAFVESGRVESDLELLQQENDGALDEVHALRDAYGADLVQLVVEEEDGCGIAYSMGRSGAAFSEWAFSVVERNCIDSSYAMAHELGHNLGCDHAPEDPAAKGAFAYSFGYKDLLAGFRTIMAYGPGRRIARFSNPGVLFGGVPAGTDRQNNARSVNELRQLVARFRPSLAAPRVVASPGAPGRTRFRLVSEGPMSEWRFFLGSTPGASDVLDSGEQTSESFEAFLPKQSASLFGRIWYRRGTAWLYADSPYKPSR
jgi:hypothetical protein